MKGDLPLQQNIATKLSKVGQVTPLVIVLSFVFLTEVVVMVGVIGTQQSTQFMLAIFIMIFPSIVALLFFWTLYSKPWVFYAPKDYGIQTDPERYIAAISKTYIPLSADMSHFMSTLDTKIERALEKNDQLQKLFKQEGADVSDLLSQIGRDVAFEIEDNNLIRVDLEAYRGETLTIPAESQLTVDRFLDFLYFEIEKIHPIRPYTYGTAWVLEDTKLKKELFEMGTKWATRHGRASDDRKLPEAGIKRGALLRVLKLQDKRR